MPSEHPIQWLNMPGYKGETLNPIRASRTGHTGWHCEKVGPGCLNCYAEKMNLAGRFHRGTKLSYKRTSRDKVKHILDRKTLEAPLHWKKPRMIFWEDMSDLLGDWVPDEWIYQVGTVMALTPRHIHCVLTKHPRRMAEWFDEPTPLWLGTSVSTQADADKNIPLLLECPAAVRFVSFEPLLERVDCGLIPSHHEHPSGDSMLDWTTYNNCLTGFRATKAGGWTDDNYKIDWGIFGFESGSRARPGNVDDIRFGVEQFRAANVPVYVKQLGANVYIRESTPEQYRRAAHAEMEWPEGTRFRGTRVLLKDSKGGIIDEWPNHLRIREFPNARTMATDSGV